MTAKEMLCIPLIYLAGSRRMVTSIAAKVSLKKYKIKYKMLLNFSKAEIF